MMKSDYMIALALSTAMVGPLMLSACMSDDEEIRTLTYEAIAEDVDRYPELAPTVQQAMADGRITLSEYDHIKAVEDSIVNNRGRDSVRKAIKNVSAEQEKQLDL